MSDIGIDPFSTIVQLMMATSLAACAGLRAWLPLLVLGTLARFDAVPLHESFAFLGSIPALVVFGLATVLEIAADKILALDHALDAASTFIRPTAGAVLAGASLVDLDPLWAVVAGIVVGGGTALTIHGGKAAVRAKSTSLAALHGGAGNAGLSVAEDGLAATGTALAIVAPVVAFVLCLVGLGLALAAIVLFVRTGKRLLSLFREKTP